jgi:xanthine dehydrogenase molybdopterin-binding subunit B
MTARVDLQLSPTRRVDIRRMPRQTTASMVGIEDFLKRIAVPYGPDALEAWGNRRRAEMVADGDEAGQLSPYGQRVEPTVAVISRYRVSPVLL